MVIKFYHRRSQREPDGILLKRQRTSRQQIGPNWAEPYTRVPGIDNRGILSLGLSEPSGVPYIDVMTDSDVGFLDVFNHHLVPAVDTRSIPRATAARSISDPALREEIRPKFSLSASIWAVLRV
jgi:hypothetical protein